MLHQKILFTKEECQSLIDYRSEVKQTLNDGGYPNRNDINYKQWTIYRNNHLEFLFSRIIDFVETSFDVKVKNFNEQSYIYQYEINDGYIMHRDNIRNRLITLGIQLSDDYEGGDLVVEHENNQIVVDKHIGNCYTFDSILLHGVSPITYGNRFNFLTFIHTYNVKSNKLNLI